MGVTSHQGTRESRAQGEVAQVAGESGAVRYARCGTPKQDETIASLPGFGMVPEGHVSSSAGPNRRTRRTKPGSVRVRIDPIPAKG